MKAVSPASGNGFSIEYHSFQRVETDFFSGVLLFRANFMLVETIMKTKVKPFLTYIFQPVKAVFWRNENVFF